MKEIILAIIYLPLRIVYGIGIIFFVLFKKEIPKVFIEETTIPKKSKFIILKRKK